MIEEATYHEVRCDYCGRLLHIDGVTAWLTRGQAEDALFTFGWSITGRGCIICDECDQNPINEDI